MIGMANIINYWGMWIGVEDDPYLYVDVIKQSNQVAIGYIYSSEAEDADLSFLTEDLELSELRARFDTLCKRLEKRAYLGERPGAIFKYFLNFVRKMKAGDIILVPSTRESLLLCEIAGNYFHVPKPGDGCDFEHRRKIRLISELKDEDLAPDLARKCRRRGALWEIRRV